MDFGFMNESVVPMIVGVCLCVGYILKNVIKSDFINKYIPTILAIVGAVVNIWANYSITPEILLGGLFSGLSSTGLHQVFKQLIDKE